MHGPFTRIWMSVEEGADSDDSPKGDFHPCESQGTEGQEKWISLHARRERAIVELFVSAGLQCVRTFSVLTRLQCVPKILKRGHSDSVIMYQFRVCRPIPICYCRVCVGLRMAEATCAHCACRFTAQSTGGWISDWTAIGNNARCPIFKNQQKQDTHNSRGSSYGTLK